MAVLWQHLTDLATAILDPFYWWVWWGALVVVGAAVVSWFFPVLRSLAGARLAALAA